MVSAFAARQRLVLDQVKVRWKFAVGRNQMQKPTPRPFQAHDPFTCPAIEDV
jgi:hypothetical protein